MLVERYEDETTKVEVARRLPLPELRRYITSDLEGWHQACGAQAGCERFRFQASR
jgi:hypothetical protein